ncbi:hypothetical protein EUTSA_v10029197mg [Eutrema salsugineum]|uniref:F-box domain-containing protein n=1 Tax=Eutrema salsugineum TaxID=72664 RepID=V4MZP7_EUTSA|nr:F-box/kelch-repeat protein At4g39590 [Eutrema salsugineum]ESQ38121.1 hypothetical protein EUTSA_v10029197mg [Eutrema salsugineum]
MSSEAKLSAATNGAKPPCSRKKKKPSPASERTSLSSLPYELLLNCIARISILYYPTLSLVSKSFRSILSSPELYRTRSRLNRTESCLYLTLHYPLDPDTYLLTLCRKPDRTVTNESSGYQFIPIPSPSFHPAPPSSIVAVGSSIYITGGYLPSSSRVSVLDCRFNTWHQAPSMRVKRSNSTASLVDGKIYVAGGCEDESSSNWVEVFDPKTQTWENVRTPEMDTRKRNNVELKSFGFGGKFYLMGDSYVVYNPEEATWKPIVDMSFAGFISYGVIDEVLFFLKHGVFRWYDYKASLWKKLNGVEGVLPDFYLCRYCKMVDLGGNMVVLWDVYVDFDGYRGTVIWCAEIALERCDDGDEIWGKVEWFDVVLRVNGSWTRSLFDADVHSASV